MSVLKLEDVYYKYKNGKKTVLKKINAEFDKGNIYTIVGKSGSGKTTLLSLISGLDTVSDGALYFEGKDVSKINRDNYRAREVGVIFQKYNLIPNATALENLLISMDVSKVAIKNKKQYAKELLLSVGIEKDDFKREVNKLSGGQQQRVSIARALSTQSNIIIADEPTSNLDQDLEDQIMDILKRLAYQEQKCVIIVTHNSKIANYGDVKYGLNSGKIMQL